MRRSLSTSGSEGVLSECKKTYETYKTAQRNSTIQTKLDKEMSIKLRRLEAELKLQEGRYRQAEMIAAKASQARDDNNKYRRLIEQGKAKQQEEIQKKREMSAIYKQQSMQLMDANKMNLLRTNKISYEQDKQQYMQNEQKRKQEEEQLLRHKQGLRDKQQQHLLESQKKLQEYYDNKQLNNIK